jgi:P21-Rho-binding domain
VKRNIPLATSIEPDSKRRYSTSTFHILFRDDSEPYTSAGLLRSSLSIPIGMPRNFVHRVHVGFNAMTGGFTVSVDLTILLLSHFMITDGVFSRVYRLPSHSQLPRLHGPIS